MVFDRLKKSDLTFFCLKNKVPRYPLFQWIGITIPISFHRFESWTQVRFGFENMGENPLVHHHPHEKLSALAAKITFQTKPHDDELPGNSMGFRHDLTNTHRDFSEIQCWIPFIQGESGQQKSASNRKKWINTLW